METIQKNQLVTTLFYYNLSEIRNKGLKKGLREYRFLLAILRSALENFQDRNLEKFDSLVGENACQIRAIKVAILSSQDKIDVHTLITQINAVCTKLEALLENRAIDSLMQSNISLQEIIEREDLHIRLSPEAMFIFQAFLLSETKLPQPEPITRLTRQDKSDPKRLKHFDPEISSSFTYNLASRARRLLAESSVLYVQQLAWESNNFHLLKMVSAENIRFHNSWPCTPMFWTYRILLHAAHKRSIPIVLKAQFVIEQDGAYLVVDEETLLFQPSGRHPSQYYATDFTEKDASKSTCVVEGRIVLKSTRSFCKNAWKERLLSFSLHDIILAGAAHHRQYPDSFDMPHLDDEYELYRSMASTNGFSIDNPTLFFIHHVYAQQANKIITPRNHQPSDFAFGFLSFSQSEL